MDLVPPPSSKRLRGTGTEIGVTMQSEVMQETFELIEQRCVKGDGAFMVVHPKDSPEFGGFIHQLCCRGLPFAPPRIMRREDTGELWSLHQNDIACSGIVLLQAEAIPNRMVPELERLLKEKIPRRLLVARFASKECLKRTANGWSKTLHSKFDPTPVVWPLLRQRKDDVHGIVDRVCAALVSKDGTHRATLSEDAKFELLRGDPPRHVNTLLARIRGAFDVSLSEDAKEITLRHLAIAGKPESRRMIFSSQPPTPTP